MAGHTLWGRFRREASGVVAVLVTGLWLALLILGAPRNLWLAVMLFGYVALVPLAGILFEADSEDEIEIATDRITRSAEEESTDTEDEAALQRLRRRYAEGELTDEQFERKLERLLETETLEDVEERYGTSRPGLEEDETGVEKEGEQA